MKKQKKPTYNLNLDQIEKIKRDATNEGVNIALIKTMYFSLMVLRDHYGFGKKRLGDFMDHMADLIDGFSKNYLTVDDMITTIYDETGVKIEKFKDGKII